MPKFQVTVFQSREFSVSVEALTERAALAIAEERVRACMPEDLIADLFEIEAIEAILLSNPEIAGGEAASASSSAARQPASSPDAGGRLPEIGRRFGLITTALAAALMLAAPEPARADRSGASYWQEIDAAPAFTTFTGGDACKPVCAFFGKFGLKGPPSSWILPGYNPYNEMAVTQSDAWFGGVYLNDGAGYAPAAPAYFEFLGFENAADTAIDYSQGFWLDAKWTDASGFIHEFLIEQPGPETGWTTDLYQSTIAYADGTVFKSASVSGAPGSWSDPAGAAVPEASTWLMLMTGFVGVAFASFSRARFAPARARR